MPLATCEIFIAVCQELALTHHALSYGPLYTAITTGTMTLDPRNHALMLKVSRFLRLSHNFLRLAAGCFRFLDQ
jgi:hypothetical protein